MVQGLRVIQNLWGRQISENVLDERTGREGRTSLNLSCPPVSEAIVSPDPLSISLRLSYRVTPMKSPIWDVTSAELAGDLSAAGFFPTSRLMARNRLNLSHSLHVARAKGYI
jgi:hypothetical protein